MLIKRITFAMLVLCGASNLFAEVCTSRPSGVDCQFGEIDKISGRGVVNIFSTKVKGLTNVSGTLSANNAKLYSLDVSGTSTLTHCEVKADTKIKGVLIASNTD